MDSITTDDAPESIGPFSQAVRDDGTIYVSGQGPVDPDTGQIVDGGAGDQTRRTLDNVAAILEAADCDFGDVVKVTVYTRDMEAYDEINDAYAEYVDPPYPARCAVEVRDLPIDIDVEIEAIAHG
ncbi:Rid family detoxifying hydrolase [Halostella pelagica]|uniref:Rid family detoxifying hydrolase n=1 Tax=Halostella pelagica TaxID=2583824 RepID=UPI00108043C6|nr:Rid family detoxifying hydrolase [Halostella pelagica]